MSQAPAEDTLGPNLRDISTEEAVRWKSFGLHVLTLCDSPFAEWCVAPDPAFGRAATQVRQLADRHGVSR